MAARRLIAIRFPRKESSIVATHNIRLGGGGIVGGGYQLRRFQVANPSTTTHQHSIIRSRLSSSQSNVAKLVSKKKKVDNKKSPHSKLLRVCSERNSNAHFAAIEADLLRLNWDESMNSLVEDWSQKKRWGDFIELESNVRLYVSKNLNDIIHYNRQYVKEYNERDVNSPFYKNNIHSIMGLEDYIRHNLFPYERIIKPAVQHTLQGQIVFSQSKMKEMEGDVDRLAYAEVQERIMNLSRVCKLLDAMVVSVNTDDDDDDDDDSNTNGTEEVTDYHIAVSNCYRSVVSGWFLLYRKWNEINTSTLEESTSPTDTLGESSLSSNPGHQMHMYAHQWISFCNKVNKENERYHYMVSSEKDQQLLMGVAKVLATSENDDSQVQSTQLMQLIDKLFDLDS